MDHSGAVRIQAVEQYLLGEMPDGLREEFEEHFFECPECAADLEMTSAFLKTAKTEFRTMPSPAEPVRQPITEFPAKTPRRWAWKPAFAFAALAAALLIIAYQNTIVYPRLRTEASIAQTPEILPQLSLVGGDSRGGNVPSATFTPNRPFLLLVDIPSQDRFSNYTCLLYSPSGQLLWSVQVSLQQARDTVSLRVPSGKYSQGRYSLLVKGNTSGSSMELAKFRFDLDPSPGK